MRRDPDDQRGELLDPDEVWEKWLTVSAELLKADALPEPVGFARLAELAARELTGVQPEPWVRLYVYHPPGAPADRWSEGAAERHRVQLAEHRTGGPFVRQPQPSPWGVADVMRFAVGEPIDRFVSKLGGLPYRPASRAWPRNRSGEPMVFFGQVCFADSRDLVGELPGDVLLIFTNGERDHISGGDLRYEWYPLGIEGLVSKTEIPDTPWRVLPCHVQLERREYDYWRDERPEWETWAKIGGRAHWVQDAPHNPGLFLAAFASVDWLGRPAGSDPKECHLDFYDAGLLNLCLLPDGHVCEHFQTH